MIDQSLTRSPAASLIAGESSFERTVHSLYQRRSQEMFGFVRRLGLDDEEASDAVQETMLRLWRELDAGTEIADPDAWTFRTLYRLGIDSHRLTRRIRGVIDRVGGRLTAASESGHHDGDPAQRIDVDAVWHAVDRRPSVNAPFSISATGPICRTSESAVLLELLPAPHEATRPAGSRLCGGVSKPRTDYEHRRAHQSGPEE